MNFYPTTTEKMTMIEKIVNLNIFKMNEFQVFQIYNEHKKEGKTMKNDHNTYIQ